MYEVNQYEGDAVLGYSKDYDNFRPRSDLAAGVNYR